MPDSRESLDHVFRDAADECPYSHMDDGSHSTDFSGRCAWCGESNGQA